MEAVNDSKKIQRKRRFSYKDRLAGEKVLYESSHSSDKSINEYLDRYHAALSGDYTHASTRTGKIIRARTYDQRLEFAELELQKVEDRLAMLSRYGKLEVQKIQEVREYARNLYRIAINENKYLEKKEIREGKAAHKLNDHIDSLETRLNGKVSKLSTMKAQTNYAAAPKAPAIIKTETLPAPSSTYTTLQNQVNIVTEFKQPISEPPAKLENQTPQTSSSLYNRLRVRDNNVPNAFQKLDDDDHTVWPVPAGWKPKKKFRISRFMSNIYSLSKEVIDYAWTGVKAGLAVGALAYLATPPQNIQKISHKEIPVFYEPTQQATQVPKVTVPTLETKIEAPIVREKSPVQRQYAGFGIGSLTLQSSQRNNAITSGGPVGTITDARVLEEVKERVRLAKEKIEAERNGSRKIDYQPTQKPMSAESPIFASKEPEKELKPIYLPITKSELMQKIADRFGKRSEERRVREGLLIVKEVTYYPGGEIVTRFPQEERHIMAKAEQQ